MLVRYRSSSRIPIWRKVAWTEDHGNAYVTTFAGLHWVVRAARWLYEQVEYKLPLRLEPEFLGYPRIYPPWAWMKWVDGDEIARRPGYGLCWSQYSPAQPNVRCRYIAPIGLNLVYALIRRALSPPSRAPMRNRMP